LGRWLLAAIALLLLIGCGADLPGPTPPPSGPAPTITVPIDMPGVVTVWGRFGEDELILLDQQIARFEAANPDLLVEIVKPEGAVQSVDALAQLLVDPNTAPDIVALTDTWLPGLAAQGLLAPLDSYVESHGMALTEFLPQTLEASRLNGVLYGLPRLTDGGLLYYRTDLLQASGLPVPATWTDIQQTALRLKAEANLKHGYVWQGAAYDSLACTTLEFVWAFGGEVGYNQGKLQFDSPEARQALAQIADLVTSEASPTDITSYREGTSLQAFAQGDAALMRNWVYAWDQLNAKDSPMQGRVGVAPLPASCQLGQTLALSAQSFYPDRAFRFMQFLTGYDAQIEMAIDLGRPPTRAAVFGDANLLAARSEYTLLGPALAETRARPGGAELLPLSEAIYVEVSQMLDQNQDPDTTAARIQQRLDDWAPPQVVGP
jgi:multiple sugar transport system substrate-binding protein